jgi:hypothetical protein
MSMLVKQAQRRLGEVEPRPETVDDQQRHVVEPLFKDLAAINRAKRSRLVVVFLPKRKDWMAGAASWRQQRRAMDTASWIWWMSLASCRATPSTRTFFGTPTTAIADTSGWLTASFSPFAPSRIGADSRRADPASAYN